MSRKADYYIVGELPPEPTDRISFVDNVLTSLGWTKGSATAELILRSCINEAFMYSRVRLHQEQMGRKVDWSRSQIEQFEGAHEGVLVCLFYE